MHSLAAPAQTNHPALKFPLARIVSICDAYDAMVSDRVYRPSRSPEVAFAELRRMAGPQFDPELVDRFIEVVSGRQGATQPASVPVSRELALNLGLQTERLAGAIDELDFAVIRAVATHLKSTAEAHGLSALAEAADLLQASAGDNDLEQLVEVVQDIMSMSLTAQQAHLAINEDVTELALARRQLSVPEYNGTSASK